MRVDRHTLIGLVCLGIAAGSWTGVLPARGAEPPSERITVQAKEAEALASAMAGAGIKAQTSGGKTVVAAEALECSFAYTRPDGGNDVVDPYDYQCDPPKIKGEKAKALYNALALADAPGEADKRRSYVSASKVVCTSAPGAVATCVFEPGNP